MKKELKKKVLSPRTLKIAYNKQAKEYLKFKEVYDKLREDYADMALRFEFDIIERTEQIGELQDCLRTLAGLTKNKKMLNLIREQIILD